MVVKHRPSYKPPFVLYNHTVCRKHINHTYSQLILTSTFILLQQWNIKHTYRKLTSTTHNQITKAIIYTASISIYSQQFDFIFTTIWAAVLLESTHKQYRISIYHLNRCVSRPGLQETDANVRRADSTFVKLVSIHLIKLNYKTACH